MMGLKKREKILLAVMIVAVAIFLFDRLFDTPMNRKISNLKEEIKAADAKLSELAMLSKGVERAEAKILQMEEELRTLSGRTLRGDEFRAFLRHLARESDPYQMKVISISPSEERRVSSDEEKKAPPRTQTVTVQVVLHSTFAKVESYLKGIEELPFLIQLEGLKMERNEELSPLLRVTLNFKISMPSPEALSHFKGANKG